MFHRLTIVTVATLVLGAELAAAAPVAAPAAPPGALDLIPEDAAVGIAIRNLADLIKKGDKFIDDGGLDNGLRPSRIFTFLYDFQGIKDAVDENAGAAILIANPDLIGAKLFDNNGAPSFPDVLNLVVTSSRSRMPTRLLLASTSRKASCKEARWSMSAGPCDFHRHASAGVSFRSPQWMTEH
jgi:hypothetical protein